MDEKTKQAAIVRVEEALLRYRNFYLGLGFALGALSGVLLALLEV